MNKIHKVYFLQSWNGIFNEFPSSIFERVLFIQPRCILMASIDGFLVEVQYVVQCEMKIFFFFFFPYNTLPLIIMYHRNAKKIILIRNTNTLYILLYIIIMVYVSGSHSHNCSKIFICYKIEFLNEFHFKMVSENVCLLLYVCT